MCSWRNALMRAIAVRIAHFVAEKVGDDDHERQRRKRNQGKEAVPLEKHGRHGEEQHKIVEHGYHAGGEEVVQSIHVSRHAGHEAPDRSAVEEANRQSLEMLKNLLAQV